MRQLLAIAEDSLREAADRRALTVLLVLAAVIILVCFSISFEGESIEDVIGEQARELGRFHDRSRGFSRIETIDTAYEVSEIRSAATVPDLPSSLQGGHAFELEWKSPSDLDRLVAAWRNFKEKTASGALPGAAPEREPANDERSEGGAPRPESALIAPKDRLSFLEERFRDFGYQHVRVEKVEDAGGGGGASSATFRVAVRSEYPLEIPGAYRLHLFFGLVDFPLPEVSVAEMVVGIQLGLANTFAGTIGMLIAVIVCSGFVPNMLQKGTLDLVLARPIGRGKLLLYKYLGGLWFIFLLSAFLVVGSWLGLSIRTGYFNPWFLASIATITGAFAVIYSVAVLMGVLTRSTGVSALVAIGVWWISSSVVTAKYAVEQMLGRESEQIPGSLRTAVDVAYKVLPKVKDFDFLTVEFLSRSHLSEQAYQRTFAGQIPDDIDWTFSLGTTALFTAAMLGLAMWRFARRDF